MSFEEKAQALFNRYDVDKNGYLDKKEFTTYFKDILKELGEDIPSEDISTIALEGVEAFDLNADGNLQFGEFKEMLEFLIKEKGLKLK
jgi:Ca2+-binding EF-hand superfamily protein